MRSWIDNQKTTTEGLTWKSNVFVLWSVSNITKSVMLTLQVGRFLIDDLVADCHPVVGIKVAVFLELQNFGFAYKQQTSC